MSKTGQKGPWTLEETQDSSITKREIVDFLQENADTPVMINLNFLNFLNLIETSMYFKLVFKKT